jgi:GAF domain-containing protein
MSHTFDLRVIAEGVETGQQLELLRAMSCDAVQGFLLSVPVGTEEVLRLLSRQNAHLRIPAPRKAEPEPEVIQEEGHRYRLLIEGAKEVTGCEDLDQVLEHAFLALGRCVSFTGGAMLLVDNDEVRIAAAMPPPTPEALAGRIPLGQGVSGTIALTGEPRYLPDITIASTVTARRRKYASGGVRSWYGVPLISEGRPIGVLQIDSTEVDAFDEADRLAVLSFAPVVALAVACAQQGLRLDQRSISAS